MSSESPIVLVVDDDPGLADLYSEWLKDHYTVHTAYGGDEAIEVLGETIDVVLLDRHMPTPSGEDVLNEIHARKLTCRVVMVSAIEPDLDIVGMGFDEYLTKPIQRADLKATVERLLALATYDTVVQECFRLASKMATLQASKSSENPANRDSFAELESRFEQVKREAQAQLETLYEADSADETIRQVIQGKGNLPMIGDR